MSIAPPSDIILDVAQAADPVRLQAASAKLARIAAEGGVPADFDAALKQIGSDAPPPTGLANSTLARSVLAGSSHRLAGSGSPYQKFEAVVLQNFVQNILPKDENLFGDAASADICRSMLAEQLANQLASSGKIGIAARIEAAHGARASDPATAPASPLAPQRPGPTFQHAPERLGKISDVKKEA